MRSGTVIAVVLGGLLLSGPAAHAQSAQAQAQTSDAAAAAPPPQPPPAPLPGTVELDHVVAIVGSDVILQSDVWQEMRFSALEPIQVLPGENTPDRALRRLINRTLIMQQMKEQNQTLTTAAAEVKKSVEELHRMIPACEQTYHCSTGQGWNAFLEANGLNEQQVQERWSQRMAIIRFIDLRFRSGIHVSQDQISSYYQKTLVPALEKNHQTAPPLDALAPRIREVLLQQQVSGLFQDWLLSLRDQGNVRIVDQAYTADLALSSNAEGQNQ